MNRPIPTIVHGILDVGGVLVLAGLPRMLNFEQNTTTFLTIVAVATALVTLLARWEISIAKVIPTGTHLTIDVMTGLLMVIAPFTFLREAGQTATTFMVAFGLFYAIVALLTKTVSPVEAGSRHANLTS